jgi:hypothetical protein
MWLNYLIHESEEEATASHPPQSPPSRPKDRHQPGDSPNSALSPLMGNGSTPTASPRMPSYLSKPSALQTSPLEYGEGDLTDGVRQVAPSPVLYPLHT